MLFRSSKTEDLDEEEDMPNAPSTRQEIEAMEAAKLKVRKEIGRGNGMYNEEFLDDAIKHHQKARKLCQDID